MVDRGKFFLYDAYLPALEAGKYQLRADVDLFTSNSTSADPDTPVDSHVTHLNITAPRFKLPPDQALMTFPPANSEGAYDNRLPQIVLKRRTLPWDRAAAPLNTKINGQVVVEETPWLALVVIAEGEGTITHDVPVADCVSDGVTLSGDFDSATATQLSVPHSTVQAIFPTIDDTIQLTHVREVNLADTEAAMADDDGFLSVIIANRMPQYDRETCKPKAYTACLINLEGQLDKLPKPALPRQFFDQSDLYLSERHEVIAKAIYSGAGVPIESENKSRKLDPSDSKAVTEAIRRGEIVLHKGRLIDRAGVTENGLNVLGEIDNTSLLEGDFSPLVNSNTEEVKNSQVLQVKGTFSGFSLPIEDLYEENIYKFPILTSWRFTSTGNGGFEKLMRNLDVGLLGAATSGGYERPQPDCTPEETGSGPANAPTSRLPLEVAETGHVSLPHPTRTGTKENSWYRSPFSPHRLLRRPIADDNDQKPVLAHVSDHLRMMTPQGQQDVSLAVAFETGRLMAMSQPSFVASLMRWRANAFGAELIIAKQYSTFLAGAQIPILPKALIEEAIGNGALDFTLEKEMFADISKRQVQAVAAPAQRVRSGMEVQALKGSANDHIALGLGLQRAALDGLAKAPDRPAVIAKMRKTLPKTSAQKPLTDTDTLNQQLESALDQGLTKLAELAIGKDALAAGGLKDFETSEDFSDFLADRLKQNVEIKK